MNELAKNDFYMCAIAITATNFVIMRYNYYLFNSNKKI